MGNLIKPAEYAKQLGISRQAVYAKIKKGILTSKSVDGKLYIVQNESTPVSGNITEATTPSSRQTGNHPSPAKPSQNFRDLLAAKDETISVLKETVVDLKDTNKMITSTLRGEVELLKEAFSEMKMLYRSRLEHFQGDASSTMAETPVDGIEHQTDAFKGDVAVEAAGEAMTAPAELGGADGEDDLAWIELEDFFDEHDIRKQPKQEKIRKRLKKLFKKGDSRIDSFNGEWILLAEANFQDILKKSSKAS